MVGKEIADAILPVVVAAGAIGLVLLLRWLTRRDAAGGATAKDDLKEARTQTKAQGRAQRTAAQPTPGRKEQAARLRVLAGKAKKKRGKS